MGPLWRPLLLTCLVTLLTPTSAVPVLQLGQKIIHDVDQAWLKLEKIDRFTTTLKEYLFQVGQDMSQILPQITVIERELLLNEYDEALKSLSKVKNTSISWKEKWDEISLLTSPVEVLFGYIKLFPDMPDAFIPGSGSFDIDANSLTDLILKPLYKPESTGGSVSTLKYLVDNVHTAVVSRSQGRKDAFALLNIHIEEALAQSYWCLWNAKTPQRIIYGLYTSLSLVDIKEFILLNFANMLRYSVNGTDSGNSFEELKTSLVHRLEEKADRVQSAMKKASSAYWRCDPIHYEEGKNYAQFQELLQGYIENESKMHHAGSCRQTCSEYNFAKPHCPYPDPDNCLRSRICTGDLIDCKFVAADSTVCPADAPRRFDYIQYKNGPTYGSTSGRCSKSTQRKDSFWRFLYHCSNCFCLCDDPNSLTTVRHISLVPAVSDVVANKIVTGVKFVMNGAVLHLQIEEGESTSEGKVIDGSTSWKPISTVDKKNKEHTAQLNYTQRAMDLDDLLVPLNHVVTGVKFRTLGYHINLEVQATQINPDTGKLLPDTSYWMSNDNTPEARAGLARQELELDDADVPTRTLHPSVPDSVHDQYVMFGPSSEKKDVAQTTLPFIDIQEVRPKPPVWLMGVGIYHKGQRGYGGFVAPRIFTHDVADYVGLAEEAHYFGAGYRTLGG